MRASERFEETLQPLIKIRDSGEVVKNPLVDAQLTLQESVATRSNFNQSPAAQSRRRSKGCPMRLRQGRQCEAESRVIAAHVALRGSTERGKASIEFHPGAEQQQIP